MCTKIMVKDKGGNVVSMRTMEAAVNMEFSMMFVPRNYEMKYTENKEIIDLGTYKTKYAVLGAVETNGYIGSTTAFHEAINEEGLSVGVNAFKKYCKYPLKNASEFVKGDFDGEQLMNYIISQFKTVQEVREFFESMEGKIFFEKKLEFNSSHIFISDKNGDAIIMEPIEGKLLVKNNPVKVLTNSPSFEMHLVNLTNYMNLNAFETKDLSNFHDEEYDLIDISSGNGSAGLPGNSYSMSRFVRAAFYQKNMYLDDDVNHTMRAMWSTANNFDIPFGSSCETINETWKKTTPDEFWIWANKEENTVIDQAVFTMVQDQTNGVVQYKDWTNNSIREVSIHDYDLDGEKAYILSVYKDSVPQATKVKLKELER